MKALILILTFFFIIDAFFSQNQATSTVVARLQMKMNESPMLNQTQQQNQTKHVGTCSYSVYIGTSCGSPITTTDQIGIKFGDDNGTEVYVPRLDEVEGATFEQCSSTSFDITGPCTTKICKMYLFREGPNGWLPSVVIASDYKYIPISFSFYNSDFTIYNSIYGYDYC